MRYLHIVGNDKKFILPFIEYVNETFNKEEHVYLFLNATCSEAKDFCSHENVIVLWPYDSFNDLIRKVLLFFKVPLSFIYLMKNYLKSDKVFIHGLFDKKVFLFLFIFRGFLKKSSWLIWGGGDLDIPKTYNCNTIMKKIERTVKKEFAEYITYVEEDYKHAVEMYGAKGLFRECLAYRSNIFNFEIKHIDVEKSNINILVGNSADETNNHIEILDRLKKYINKDIKIYCILSYAEKPWTPLYKEKVIKYGKKIFGEKFIPITEFMPYEAYIEFLNTMDIAIFDHEYQQAMGNTITLLGLGKKVFLRDNVPHKTFLKGLGIRTFSSNNISLEKINEDDSKNNMKIIKEYFTEENLHKQWEAIFNDKSN